MFNKTTKLILMFLPLGIAFTVVSVGIMDLKHPEVQVDQCQVVGRGPAIQKFKITAKTLYRISDQPAQDIGLHCTELGNVLVNDIVPLPFKPGEAASIRIKRYQYFPDRYYFALPVINPGEAQAMVPEKNDSPPAKITKSAP
jgi:hypothetical protein